MAKTLAKSRSKKRSKKPPREGLVTTDVQRASIAMDYYRNLAARMGYGTPSLAESTEYNMVRLSNNYWLMLTLYRNHWLARRIVDTAAIDMTRRWATLNTDLPPDDIKRFDQSIQRSCVPQRITQALKWSRLYGGAGALMVIDGHERYLDEELHLEDITPGSFRGLIPFDRWVGIQPEAGTISTDFDRPEDWGLPEYYTVTLEQEGAQSFRVHSSRILRFTGPEVPTPELQAQIYWGISVLELVWEELRKRDNASWAILQLLFRANVISQTNDSLASALSGATMSQAALQAFASRMEAQNQLLSNQSMIILPKDGRLDSVSYTFTGLGEVLSQFQMDVAGASGYTVSRIFGRTVTGLGQSNDEDERMYESRIAQDQEDILKPALNKLYPVIAMSEFGEVPDDLDFDFPSVRILTEEEKAEMTTKGSAPVIASYNAGLISERTALKELRAIGEVTGIFTNITDEDIDAASDQPQRESDLPGLGNMNPQREEKKLAGGAEDSKAELHAKDEHSPEN